MAKFLWIALWNANGLAQHKVEIQLFLQHNIIDILLISVTHFTMKSYFKIPQYNIYYTNHPDRKAHAGTAILIKRIISHYEVPNYDEDSLQATSIRVRTLPYELTVTALYSPPKYNLKKDHYDSFLSTLGPRFMAGGDYNGKHTTWGSRITTIKGKELFNLLQEKNYSFLTTGNPTYWPTDPTKQPDCLDFSITNGISSTYTATEPSHDLSSDH